MAATAPSRLAHEADGEVLWRQRAGGDVEIAVLRDLSVERYLVDEAGRRTQLASFPPTAGERSASRLANGGWLVALSAFVLGLLGAGDAVVAITFFAGFALFAYGGHRSWRAGDLRSRLAGLGEDPRGWVEPTDLHGWAPRTGAQLAAVEQIADEHGGLAEVEDAGSRAVYVVAERGGRAARYSVDERGCVELVEARTSRLAFALAHTLGYAALALSAGLVLVAVLVHEHTFRYLAATGLGLALTAAALAVASRHRAERELGPPLGAARFEIRTLVDDDGGD